LKSLWLILWIYIQSGFIKGWGAKNAILGVELLGDER
jgi:hypothetical protein